MKDFLYTGDSVMNFSLNTDGKIEDFTLIPGEKCSLPEKNQHVKVLLAKGFIEEAPIEKNSPKNK